jgi:hypothetical protein
MLLSVTNLAGRKPSNGALFAMEGKADDGPPWRLSRGVNSIGKPVIEFLYYNLGTTVELPGWKRISKPILSPEGADLLKL